jgi:hypothetical protein
MRAEILVQRTLRLDSHLRRVVVENAEQAGNGICFRQRENFRHRLAEQAPGEIEHRHLGGLERAAIQLVLIGAKIFHGCGGGFAFEFAKPFQPPRALFQRHIRLTLADVHFRPAGPATAREPDEQVQAVFLHPVGKAPLGVDRDAVDFNGINPVGNGLQLGHHVVPHR